jgi:hypothetical protein
MATTGTITISGTVTGGPSGQRTFSSSIPITAGVDQSSVITLNSGANTITPPTGATVAVIFGANATQPQPNPLNTATLLLKGVTGDTGISLSSTYPTVLTFGTLPATFVITASAGSSCEIFYA